MELCCVAQAGLTLLHWSNPLTIQPCEYLKLHTHATTVSSKCFQLVLNATTGSGILRWFLKNSHCPLNLILETITNGELESRSVWKQCTGIFIGIYGDLPWEGLHICLIPFFCWLVSRKSTGRERFGPIQAGVLQPNRTTPHSSCVIVPSVVGWCWVVRIQLDKSLVLGVWCMGWLLLWARDDEGEEPPFFCLSAGNLGYSSSNFTVPSWEMLLPVQKTGFK